MKKYGFKNSVNESLYDEVTEFWEGFAAVRKGGKWGLVNDQGEEVILCKYDEAWPFFTTKPDGIGLYFR